MYFSREDYREIPITKDIYTTNKQFEFGIQRRNHFGVAVGAWRQYDCGPNFFKILYDNDGVVLLLGDSPMQRAQRGRKYQLFWTDHFSCRDKQHPL